MLRNSLNTFWFKTFWNLEENVFVQKNWPENVSNQISEWPATHFCLRNIENDNFFGGFHIQSSGQTDGRHNEKNNSS